MPPSARDILLNKSAHPGRRVFCCAAHGGVAAAARQSDERTGAQDAFFTEQKLLLWCLAVIRSAAGRAREGGELAGQRPPPDGRAARMLNQRHNGFSKLHYEPRKRPNGAAAHSVAGAGVRGGSGRRCESCAQPRCGWRLRRNDSRRQPAAAAAPCRRSPLPHACRSSSAVCLHLLSPLQPTCCWISRPLHAVRQLTRCPIGSQAETPALGAA